MTQNAPDLPPVKKRSGLYIAAALLMMPAIIVTAIATELRHSDYFISIILCSWFPGTAMLLFRPLFRSRDYASLQQRLVDSGKMAGLLLASLAAVMYVAYCVACRHC